MILRFVISFSCYQAFFVAFLVERKILRNIFLTLTAGAYENLLGVWFL